MHHCYDYSMPRKLPMSYGNPLWHHTSFALSPPVSYCSLPLSFFPTHKHTQTHKHTHTRTPGRGMCSALPVLFSPHTHTAGNLVVRVINRGWHLATTQMAILPITFNRFALHVLLHGSLAPFYTKLLGRWNEWGRLPSQRPRLVRGPKYYIMTSIQESNKADLFMCQT